MDPIPVMIGPDQEDAILGRAGRRMAPPAKRQESGKTLEERHADGLV
jgi:hypothetical protein